MELGISPPESMAWDSACSGPGFIPNVPIVKRRRTTRRRRISPDISSNAAASVSVTEEEADTANCLILLAQGCGTAADVYGCTSCNRSFRYRRVLGGHKKPKLAVTDEGGASGGPRRGARTHECAVCGSEFSSGQALGGHMRRHRAPVPPAASGGEKRSFFSLDLNLPAPGDDEQEEEKLLGGPSTGTSQAFTFVVGASTLVDCHY